MQRSRLKLEYMVYLHPDGAVNDATRKDIENYQKYKQEEDELSQQLKQKQDELVRQLAESEQNLGQSKEAKQIQDQL